MNLDEAIHKSNEELTRSIRQLLVGDDNTTSYWAQEISTQGSACQLALQKILGGLDAQEPERLATLLKSMENELESLVADGQVLVGLNADKKKQMLEQAKERLLTHIRRHEVKGHYLATHLSDFVSGDSTEALGTEFIKEREELARRMRIMDSGG